MHNICLNIIYRGSSYNDSSLSWNHYASWGEALVSHSKDAGKHVLEEQKVSHPLRDNDVSQHPLQWGFFSSAAHHLYDILEAFSIDLFLTPANDSSLLYRVNSLRATVDSCETKNTCACTNIDDGSVF